MIGDETTAGICCSSCRQRRIPFSETREAKKFLASRIFQSPNARFGFLQQRILLQETATLHSKNIAKNQ